MAKSAPEYESCNRESLSRAWLELSLISHLNSVLVGERPGRDLGWSVPRSVMGDVVRGVVRTVGHSDRTELGGSQAEREASQ